MATNIESEYVILIAIPRQKWLRERASMLHYTYIACLLLWDMKYYKATTQYTPSDRTMALGSTPLTEMSTSSISWE